MRVHRYYILLVLQLAFLLQLSAQETEKVYLSGNGPDDAVSWDFMCTSGMNAGKWTTIPVPSCWELQGFGKYDYGFAKDSVKGKEKGLYKKKFNVPASWKGKVINIVFEGVMTDAEVKINGQSAGPIHQGAFYVFRYEISKYLKFGKENLLEVTVAKHSANESVNAAERRGDFWVFGGIFRPVWLEVLPAIHINEFSIDAKADGLFRVSVWTNDKQNRKSAILRIYDHTDKLVIADTGAAPIANNSEGFIFGKILKDAKAWSPETPYLYKAEVTIFGNGFPLHRVSKKFGFRTVELKPRDGIYVNGVKMKFKGVNRHCFRPETGRTLGQKQSIEDVLLIKEMNMNAVRAAHYPPDAHFLDACDSLGLFVMDELAGWHGHYDTPTGRKLLEEMITQDGNHPSIILWANGNEGGHNRQLDKLFEDFDMQDRPVLHPWENFNGVETQHYREYNYGIGNYENGREIVMPTEFLHGWFDGGHGAGLEDYWEKMWHNPLSAGGFLWDFADNAVVRKDLKDSLDTDKHRAADGIVGPHFEKEGSFYAIKEIWSPIRFERKEITLAFNGKLNIENRYHFTNTSSCSFSWKLKRFNIADTKEISGEAMAPDIQPEAKGVLSLALPADWEKYDVLYVTARDPFKRELFTWSFTLSSPDWIKTRMVDTISTGEVRNPIGDTTSILVHVKDVQLMFNGFNGMLEQVRNKKGILPFNNGPVIQEGANNFARVKKYREGNKLVLTTQFDRKESYNTLQWTIYPSGWVKLEVQYFPGAYFTNFAGINFSFPEKEIKSVTYMGNGPYRVWKNRMKGNQFGVWNKTYNSTETGESPWIYPEFKGYHSNFYGGYFFTNNNQFTVVTETEDLFLRLFTPAWKTDQWHNYEPYFPSGDISFMQGIPSIGTKSQRNETTGPMGIKNMYYDYEKDPARALRICLWFNFSSQ